MSRQKNETLTIRTTAEIKDLLRQAADREHRSLASMIEVLVMEYAKKAKLQPSVIALQTAFITGVFAITSSREHAAERHQALQEVKRLRVEIARIKAAATKEKQIARQVELNTEIKRLERDETQFLKLLRIDKP